MKINTISCTQFAGIQNQSISFADGLNLIYGKNESGKSTLVNLLSRTLFQNAHLDGRSDKVFKDLYFPSAKKDKKTSGDFSDGRVTIETEDGIYTLTKEWSGDPRCLLSSPDGVFRDQKKIDSILRQVLHYGEGVYSDLLFSSQYSTTAALQTILDASKKTEAKHELTNAISLAFSESDGIAVDTIEQAVYKKIDELAGKHWDTTRNLPARKSGRWVNGLGEVLKAYYKMEDARAVLDMIACLELDTDRAAEDYLKKDEVAQMAAATYDQFNSFAGQLKVKNERARSISHLEAEVTKAQNVLSDWPNLVEDLQKATRLKIEQERRAIIDCYEAAKKKVEEIQILKGDISSKKAPTQKDISTVKKAQQHISMLENKLCGMNLAASLQMNKDYTIRITSLRTGQDLAAMSNLSSIKEAVKITVPGVMELTLCPADVDAAEVEAEIEEKQRVIDLVFNIYSVESVEELEELVRTIDDTNRKLGVLSEQLSVLLNGTDYHELESSAKAINEMVRCKMDIEQDILSVCGNRDVIHYITEKETILQSYKNEYGDIESLKKKIHETNLELSTMNEAIKEMDKMPSEYAGIVDPDAHLALLHEEARIAAQAREYALKVKTATASKLESYKENLGEDPTAVMEQAERTFSEKKDLLAHWMHIADVLAQKKQEMQNNPMQDLSNSFSKYLDLISYGNISSEFPAPDKIGMNIYSGSNLMDFNKLSEGTKETVSLAFRLAVLDHLFPDGGGVIVFDDPFTDMDADRTRQACKLIKECSKRHQVIFLTCKEEYLSMLGGNEIRI